MKRAITSEWVTHPSKGGYFIAAADDFQPVHACTFRNSFVFGMLEYLNLFLSSSSSSSFLLLFEFKQKKREKKRKEQVKKQKMWKLQEIIKKKKKKMERIFFVFTSFPLTKPPVRPPLSSFSSSLSLFQPFWVHPKTIHLERRRGPHLLAGGWCCSLPPTL